MIGKLWGFVSPQVKFWIYVLGLILFIGSYVFVFYQGAEWKAERMKNKVITKTITVREKQNEVRDNRPSVSSTVDRMRNNTF